MGAFLRTLWVAVLLAWAASASATHNEAGEILVTS